MPHSKPVVFISHIHEERELAIKFKELVNQEFLGMIDLFVSSDGQSIESGNQWFNELTDALENCVLMIALCSPKSIKRPWINFEAGAGWVKSINVIPLCHSGMTLNALPIPYSLRQAANATTATHLEQIFVQLAKALGSSIPKVDFNAFIDSTSEFEEKYTFWDRCNAAFAKLRQIDPKMVSLIKMAVEQGRSLMLEFPLAEASDLRPHMEFLEEQNILGFGETGYLGVFAGTSQKTRWDLYPKHRLMPVLTNANFQFVNE